ncbi:MAG: GH3 auxin-responsive promoter family protein, partial [bacterium]
VEKAVLSLSHDLNAFPGEFFVTGHKRNHKPNYIWVFEENDVWSQRGRRWLSRKLDDYLMEHNQHYKYFIGGELNPCEVYFVDKSVFQGWYRLHKADLGHTKIPRIVTDPAIAQYFFNNITLK